MVDNWPGRGFYRGNKNALLADTNRVLGIVAQPPEELGGGRAITDPKMPPGAIGTWVKRPDIDKIGEYNRTHPEALPGEKIGATELGPVKMKREQATQMGYTGDACDHCGSMKMKVTGHCNTCEECGTTTGCS